MSSACSATASVEFVGRHTREIFTPEDRAAGVPERELAFAAAEGEASDERWLIRKDGSRFWASGLTYRLRGEGGRLVGFGKVFRDLTIERQFDEELRRTTERYRIAARAAHEALWDRDLNSDTITWAEGFDQVFGWNAEEIGRDIAWWEKRIHTDDRAEVVEGIHRAIREGSADWEAEYRFRRADGDYALVHDRALITRSSDGVPLRMLGAARDVTLERRSELLRRQAQSLEGLGRLAGGVAHDLNNMLMAIIGFGEILERDLADTDERRRYTGEILGLGQPVGRPDAAPARVRPPRSDPAGRVRSERGRRQARPDAALPAGRCGRAEAAPGLRPDAGAGRSGPDRAGTRRPRPQRSRRHAPGRPPHHRDRGTVLG